MALTKIPGSLIEASGNLTITDLTVTGDLSITGDLNSYNVTDLDVVDQTITLGAGQTEALSGGSGIIIDGSSASLLWDETNDEWDFNKSINVTGTVVADGLTVQTVQGDIEIANSGAVIDMKRDSTNYIYASNAAGNLRLGSGGSFNRLNIASNGDISFYEDTGTTAKLFWDASAESLGIGTSADLNASLTVLDTNYTTSSLAGTGLNLRGSSTGDGTYSAALTFTNGYRTGHSAIAGVAENADNDVMGIAFFTHASTGGTVATSEAMRIDSSGNVGIGTNDPQQLLHINAASPNILLSGTSFPALKFSGSDNTTDAEIYYGVGASDWNFNNYNNGRTVFKNNNVETVRINADGSVGIGTLGDASFASGSGLEIQRAGIATLRLQNTSGKSVEITQDSDFKIECINSSSDIHLIPTSFVGVGTETPDSTLHVKGTSQLNLLKIERAGSTPGITFVNGAETSGTFGFQLMDADEYWAGRYDGSNYDYWFKGNPSVFRVEKPVASNTDSGTKQYSHLCTGSFYSSTGAIVIDTNIPAHDDSSGNANMFSIKIRGFEYAIHGSIDLNVGCYAGENNYYSANYNSNYIADGWRGNIKFAKNDTTGKLAIILGTTSTAQRCELAVVDFIQGFQNVNESYANGWSMSVKTSLSNYSSQTDMAPRHQSPRPGFHAYLTSNTSFADGVAARLLTSTSFNEGDHYNTSNGRFTAPTEGVYQFNFAFQGSSSSVNQTYVSAEARVNGSTRYVGGWFNKTTGGNNGTNTYSAATGSALIKLSRNDYVEFVCELSNTDTALGGQPGYTYFSGILVG